VIAAADPALERDPELERRSAVRTVQVQYADAPAAITEHHEVFAEDAHAPGRGGEIARERDRLPEASEILSAGSPRADLSQLRIRRGDVTSIIAVEWTCLGLGGARSGSLHGSICLAPGSEPSQAAARDETVPLPATVIVMVAASSAHRNGHRNEQTGRGSKRNEKHE